jgi:cobalt-zinc-cadmium efflux system outer membrane protein
MLHKQLAKGICTICCMYFLNIHVLHAQAEPVTDTLRLALQDAEKMFLDKNLSLLAEHYNIQSSQALVEQARKWDNPVLNTDQNIYANNHFFEHKVDLNGTGQGEFYAQVQQLIKTAGKRGKQVNLAKTNVNIAEWQFKDVLRNLRATLFEDFYTIAQLQGVAELNRQNVVQLNKLLTGMSAQLQAGNIARKEYLRVEALQVGLQQDMAENAKDLNDAEAELKTMLQVTGDMYIKPKVQEEESAYLPYLSVPQLVDSAKLHNTDYQAQVYQLQYQRQNYSLQRALSVPDVTFGPEFDQAANYAPNYVGLTISLPLPIWDRNQGNIKSSRYQIKQEEAKMQQVDQKLQNDVMNAYQKLLLTAKLSSSQNNSFYKDYYQLYDNILKSYNQRQISLLEFLDYFNDYEDIRQKQLQQTLNLRLAKEGLNDMIGMEVVN